jgi:hypothetical protein
MYVDAVHLYFCEGLPTAKPPSARRLGQTPCASQLAGSMVLYLSCGRFLRLTGLGGELEFWLQSYWPNSALCLLEYPESEALQKFGCNVLIFPNSRL